MCDTFLHSTNWQVDATILIYVSPSSEVDERGKLYVPGFSFLSPLHIPLYVAKESINNQLF